MRITTLLFTFIIFRMSFQVCQSAIYVADKSFDETLELEYREWVKKTVSSEIFSHPNSPYYGIKTDCADAAIALRLIFAFENKISFSFKDNEGNLVTEKTNRFDHFQSSQEKLKKLIDYLADKIGSETLAHSNTYPIQINQINSGDLYITRWKNKKGEYTRHVYIIKDILPTGDLLLLSSTQPRAIRPLLARKGMPLHFFGEAPFGFRRFFQPGQQIPSQLPHYSLEQYDLKNKGETAFFNHLKNTLKNSEDSLKLNIQRRIENICVALTARADIIDMAIEYKKDNNIKCFSKGTYDEFSTPSRDQNIFNDIERLRAGVKSILSQNLVNDIDENVWLGLNFLLNSSEENRNDEGGLESIKNFCTIEVQIDSSKTVLLNMKSFYERFKKGYISSNPNESLPTRWGLAPKKSNCPSY